MSVAWVTAVISSPRNFHMLQVQPKKKKELELRDESTRSLGFGNLVSEQVPVSRKVTVHADRNKVNPNLIHVIRKIYIFSPALTVGCCLLPAPIGDGFPLSEDSHEELLV